MSTGRIRHTAVEVENLISWVRAIQDRAIERLLSIEAGDIIVVSQGMHNINSWQPDEYFLVLDVNPIEIGKGAERTQFNRHVKVLTKSGVQAKCLFEHYFYYDKDSVPNHYHIRILKHVSGS